ncbi:MAG: hypothetical protein AB7T06_12025 [Kofleriaceae bacterium]
MKLKMAQPPTKEQVKQFLEARRPQYKYGFRAGRMVDVQKSFLIGATITPKKDGLVINGNFPSVGASLVWVIIIFGSGVLIGLILWLALWKGAQDKVRDDVAQAFKDEMGAQAA